MEKNKRKKHSLTDSERQKIKELKAVLSAQGVPRELWSSYIQQELSFQKASKKGLNVLKVKAESISPLRRLWQNILEFLKRIAFKRSGMDTKAFSSSFDHEHEDMLDFERSFLPEFPERNVEDLGKNGTFILKRPDKKSEIVNLDDEDEKN